MLYRCLTLLICCTLCTAGLALASAGAKIGITTATVEFGVINQGEKVDQRFLFRNIGDEPLVLGQIKTSCGCTVALPSRTSLLPGEEGELKVTFDSGRFTGKIEKEIYLASNDKENPVAKLILKGTVEPAIILLPEALNFGDILQAEKKTLTVKISNQGRDNLEITAIDLPLPSMTVTPVTTVVGRNKSTLFTVSISAPAPGQRVSGYLLIHTNRPEQPTLRLPVYAAGLSR